MLLKLEQGEQLGLIVGGVSSGLLLLLNLKRSFDTGDSFTRQPWAIVFCYHCMPDNGLQTDVYVKQQCKCLMAQEF